MSGCYDNGSVVCGARDVCKHTRVGGACEEAGRSTRAGERATTTGC